MFGKKLNPNEQLGYGLLGVLLAVIIICFAAWLVSPIFSLIFSFAPQVIMLGLGVYCLRRNPKLRDEMNVIIGRLWKAAMGEEEKIPEEDPQIQKMRNWLEKNPGKTAIIISEEENRELRQRLSPNAANELNTEIARLRGIESQNMALMQILGSPEKMQKVLSLLGQLGEALSEKKTTE